MYRLVQYFDFNSHKKMLHLFEKKDFLHFKMKTINPTCTDADSFKYSVLISLHYHDLYNHKERINQLKNNICISLTVYDEQNEILYNSKNKSNNKAYITKINSRYYALKPDKDKFVQLKHLLKQFTHKELTEYILNNVTQS